MKPEAALNVPLLIATNCRQATEDLIGKPITEIDFPQDLAGIVVECSEPSV